jgi:2,4-diketo-3-deoxy-L-fuconate hydrolase
MFLANINYRGRDLIAVRWGDDQLLALDELISACGASDGCIGSGDMLAVIMASADLLESIARLVSSTTVPKGVAAIPVGDVQWHPPVRNPGKIVGVAMNNSASDARKISSPNHPMFFIKPRSCLLGHLREIEIRSYYGSVHPEPELAVVIGKRARDLSPQNALEYVFGYTIMNDMTGNAMRAEDMVHYYALYGSETDVTKLEKREQHLSYAARYKGTDGFGPMGPWLVTRGAIRDPGILDVTCKVGADTVAEDSTRHLTYSVEEILAFLSRFQTLEPGDIISMGTAFRQKTGLSRSIHTADLQRVDGPVVVEISGLGTLCTPTRRVQMDIGEWRSRPAADIASTLP